VKYRLTLEAQQDLAAIFWHGLEQFGSARTERYLEEIEQVFAFLCEYPEAARLRTEIDPPVRAYPQEAHVIIYEIEGSELVIIRIRSARENWVADPRRGAP
jgi:toxin ParE1/3/4